MVVRNKYLATVIFALPCFHISSQMYFIWIFMIEHSKIMRTYELKEKEKKSVVCIDVQSPVSIDCRITFC